MNSPNQPKRKTIFISYREKDTSGETGRLVSDLKKVFDASQIFHDIEKLEPGVDFTVVLAKYLETSDVLLAIIGPYWAGPLPGGSSRIMQEKDWVRMEIESALKRGIRVIPVLVGNASLPEPEDLPESLHPLLNRQTVEISPTRWDYDTGQLIGFLKNKVGVQPKVQRPAYANPGYNTPATTKKSSSVLKYLIGAFALFAFLVVIGIVLYSAGDAQNGSDEEGSRIQPLYDSTAMLPATDQYEQDVVDDVNSGTDQLEQHAVPTDVSGTWDDLTGAYKVHITQNGNVLNLISTNMFGETTGTGEGYINGENVEFNINILSGGSITASGVLGTGGGILSGNWLVNMNGTNTTEQFSLRKN